MPIINANNILLMLKLIGIQKEFAVILVKRYPYNITFNIIIIIIIGEDRKSDSGLGYDLKVKYIPLKS
jgi:hypothetical protein